jgi:prevent-host-death family protein
MPIAFGRMITVELRDVLVGFGRLIGRVETGERMRVTDGGEPLGVLLPAAELAELEHFAQRSKGGPHPGSRAVRDCPIGPEQQGPYIRYVHSAGCR